MIFITVGSQKFQFDRLLKAVDEQVACGEIKEKVFAQRGACTYIPAHYESKAFLDRDEFQESMKQCDTVITHGGTGAIVGALKAGKKVIAVPRRKQYGEHVDDHQMQLIRQFTNGGLIAQCGDLEELPHVLAKLHDTHFERYVSNTEAYLQDITRYIDSL